MVRKTHGTGEASADVAELVQYGTSDLEQGSNQGASAALLSFCERFERLSEEIGALNDDRKEVMDEAKAVGFDTKVLRQALRRRSMDAGDRQHADAMLERYETALERAGKAKLSQGDEK